MDMLMFKATRGFTEHVPGQGMVVFNAPKAADKGNKGRAGTSALLPYDMAVARAQRGFGEVTGKGAPRVGQLTAADRRERRLADREARRANLRADGGVNVAEDEENGERFLASQMNRDAREAADPQPGDGKTAVRADGNGNQVDSTPGPQTEANVQVDEGKGKARGGRGARSAGNATAENGSQTETPSDAPTE